MSTIGKISKYWSGFVNNVFTNTANFGIQVPVDLDVKIKAVMIGACFLIVSMKNQEVVPRAGQTGTKEVLAVGCDPTKAYMQWKVKLLPKSACAAFYSANTLILICNGFNCLEFVHYQL